MSISATSKSNATLEVDHKGWTNLGGGLRVRRGDQEASPAVAINAALDSALGSHPCVCYQASPEYGSSCFNKFHQ